MSGWGSTKTFNVFEFLEVKYYIKFQIKKAQILITKKFGKESSSNIISI